MTLMAQKADMEPILMVHNMVIIFLTVFIGYQITFRGSAYRDIQIQLGLVKPSKSLFWMAKMHKNSKFGRVSPDERRACSLSISNSRRRCISNCRA